MRRPSGAIPITQSSSARSQTRSYPRPGRDVLSVAPKEPILAPPTVEVVTPTAAVEFVVSAVACQSITTATAQNQVVTAVAVKVVGPIRSDDAVIVPRPVDVNRRGLNR